MRRKPPVDVFDQIASFPALLAATQRAARGKRERPDAAEFLFRLETQVLRLSDALYSGEWCPGGYRKVVIHEAKTRHISIAPFADRVVHQALHGVLGPLAQRSFISDSFASLPGRGQHRAIARYEQFRDTHAWVLRCDIHRFFPSIDHAVAKADARRCLSNRNRFTPGNRNNKVGFRLVARIPPSWSERCRPRVALAHQAGYPGRCRHAWGPAALVAVLVPAAAAGPFFFFGKLMSPQKPTPKPSPERQRWLDLDGLAQHYLALPAGDTPAREQLRKQILRLLAAGWVKFISDDEVQRETDVLSRTFRKLALRLAAKHGNRRLIEVYGDVDNLAAEGKSEFLTRRAVRAGKQRPQQSFLTGLLSGWRPADGDLRVFMETAVESFLVDMYRQCFKRKDNLKGAPGAKPRGFVTENTPIDSDDADPDGWLDAMAMASTVAGTLDPQAALQTEEVFACIEEARYKASASWRALYDSEIQYHTDKKAFTREQQAASLGIGSHNTLLDQRRQLHADLRKVLAAAGHTQSQP